jgi:hypothetical protein
LCEANNALLSMRLFGRERDAQCFDCLGAGAWVRARAGDDVEEGLGFVGECVLEPVEEVGVVGGDRGA